MIDILIVGGGPAGLTAAIYAARAGRAVTLCEKESIGGQIALSHQVDNYPGLPRISGMALSDAFFNQAMDAGAKLSFGAVKSIVKNDDGTFTADTEDGIVEAKAVIYAAGASPRPIGLPREDALIGHGISYCALCDGAFFKGMDVIVLGGGNTAFSDALFLSKLCKKVTLIHRRDSYRAEQASILLAQEAENITLLTNCVPTKLLGESHIEGLEIKNSVTGEVQTILADGIFVAYGRQPECSLIKDMADFDPQGYAASGEHCSTKTKGLYVAGDCRSKEVRQLTTATADGTIAATAACEYLDMQ